ncbi:hypothetical protein QYF36_000853 [Acer negundo]|nr:hypothetical protein QYF36_000853 [Acer negundo]
MLSQVAFLQVIPLRWISWLLTPQVVGNSLINLEHNYLSRNLQLFRKPKRTLIGMSEMHLRSGKKESTCLLIFRQITQTQDGVEDDNADEYGYANEFENGTAQALDPATAEQIDTEVNGSKPDEDSLAADHRDDATEMEIYKKGSKSHPIEHHASILKSKMEQLMQISDPNKSPIDKSPEVHRDDDDGAQGSLSESLDDASALWRRYELQTTRLSLELAEQLLLVVEPTLASKLQGDYKTGKRINMKRYNTVISYIASHYRKDKIWLRRPKPNNRDYQVVIAVDDSRSMSESGCGDVAIEALVIVCRAMAQLETGNYRL